MIANGLAILVANASAIGIEFNEWLQNPNISTYLC